MHALRLGSRHVGGGLASQSELNVPKLHRKRLVILVHGYGTDEESATAAYENFIGNVERGTGLARSIASTDFLGVHWPGHDRSAVISKLSFASRVYASEISGQLLAQVVAGYPHREVYFVAHSLGCRAVLEALVVLNCISSVHELAGSILMAAAVPVDHCDSRGVYSLERVGDSPQVALWSSRDVVLATVFRPGMRLARENASRAVGLTGGPRGRWHSTSEDIRLSHSAYWASPKSAETLRSLLRVGQIRTTPDRTTPTRTQPEREVRSRRNPSRP
jgi:pimeloyl-ACP methyl ester carboxylesterase